MHDIKTGEITTHPELQSNVSAPSAHELVVALWWLENHPEQAYMFYSTEALNQRGHELRQQLARLTIDGIDL